MRGKFRGIRGLDACYGSALFKRAAMDQDFLDTLEAHWLGTWRYYLFWSWGFFLDYGRSLSRVALIGLSTIVAYAVVFSLVAGLIIDDGPSKSVVDPLYFSVVTFTTLGYGDVLPGGNVGKIVAGSEVLIGYVTLGLLLSVLANKLARRS
jgi:voltage-gated potassium channel Kch